MNLSNFTFRWGTPIRRGIEDLHEEFPRFCVNLNSLILWHPIAELYSKTIKRSFPATRIHLKKLLFRVEFEP